MMRQVVNINWRYIGDAVPAFVTVMFIPFGYSAAYGLIAGLMTYTALNGLIYLTKVVTRGYLVPDDEDHREYWTSKFSLQCASPLDSGTNMTCSQTSWQATLVYLCKPASRRPFRARERLKAGCSIHEE